MNTLIPSREFARAFFGSERTARRHRARGNWPAYIKVGKRIFVRPEAIDAWLKANEIGGGAA